MTAITCALEFPLLHWLAKLFFKFLKMPFLNLFNFLFYLSTTSSPYVQVRWLLVSLSDNLRQVTDKIIDWKNSSQT